jgi:short-subunit dehydrogenase
MATALITGASSGIGQELAIIHAAAGDNLILVARSGSKLLELKNDLESKHRIRVVPIEKDLSAPGAARTLYEETHALGLSVDYLINNAGFGDFGFFHESDPGKTDQMIQLNMAALTQLCRFYVTDMIARKKGRIMNVASTAAFQPGPLMAVYFATKAYVLHFSEAMHNELSGTGVTVTALCPGATESGFKAAAAMEDSGLMKGKKLPTSAEVARFGYKAMLRGRPVCVHGALNAFLAASVGLMPRQWAVAVTRKMLDRV